MALPLTEEVTAPSGDVFQLWARDSGVHIDCSVDHQGDVTDQDTVDKYDKHNCHPADESDATTHFNALKTAIEAGDDLPDSE